MGLEEAIVAIPWWVDGRAQLGVTPHFLSVCPEPCGRAVRRLPLAGPAEFAAAVASARRACPRWRALGADERARRLVAWRESLCSLSSHFAALLAEDSGVAVPLAEQEVAQAIASLTVPRNGACPPAEVFGVSGSGQSFATFVGHVAAALGSGAAVIASPSPRWPAAALALAELSAWTDVLDTAANGVLPPGTFNVLYTWAGSFDAGDLPPDVPIWLA